MKHDILDTPFDEAQNKPMDMDQEMNFPNPVVRTDLPTKRRRWPKVVAALGVFLILIVAFLPQIIGTKIGRRFVVDYLEGKTNSKVTLESVKTSWFGGTSVRFLAIKDKLGRNIMFKSLTCEASLLDLLRGNYELGDTTIDGLTVNYTLDDGRGSDTLDMMADPQAKTPAPGAAAVEKPLPKLSGKFKVTSGELVLWRGAVQAKMFNTAWQSARLVNIDLDAEIDALDKPIKFDVYAQTLEESGEAGEINTSGTIDFDALDMDFKIEGEKTRIAPLLATLISGLPVEEVRKSLGPAIAKFEIIAKGKAGKISIEKCHALGADSQIDVYAKLDFASSPAVLSIDRLSQISMGISRRLAAEWLVYINPFVREATGTGGRMDMTIETLNLPLGPRWKNMSGRGVVTFRDVPLARLDEMSSTQTLPNNLASQLALLTADERETVMLNAGMTPVSVNDGIVVAVTPSMTIDRLTMVVEGTTSLAGKLEMSLMITPDDAVRSVIGVPMVPVALGGTVDAPRLGLATIRGVPDEAIKAIAARVSEQTSVQRTKETRRLLNKSQQTVQDILRPLQPDGSTEKK